MATQLFRPEVIEARRERLTGTVIAATPPGSRAYTAALCAVAAALLALLVFGHYASTARVPGEIVYSAGVSRVYAPAAGVLRAVQVTEGQAVEAGAPLATIALNPGRDSLGEGMASRSAALVRQDGALALQQSLAVTMGSAETLALEQQRTGLTATIDSLERQRALSSRQIDIAQADTKRAARLAAEGAGTQRQVEESRSGALAKQLDFETLAERIISQREALRNIDSQVRARQIAANQAQAELAAQRAALAEQQVQLARQDSLVLTAPIAGVIGDLSARPGQEVRPDASILSVMPRDSQLEVHLYAPTRSIGFVRPGQEVRLQFDAFPYQKYGACQGRVLSVAQFPREPSGLDARLGITEPVFRVTVSVDPNALAKSTGGGSLRAGMTLSANLVLENRRLWEIFFEPVLKVMRR